MAKKLEINKKVTKAKAATTGTIDPFAEAVEPLNVAATAKRPAAKRSGAKAGTERKKATRKTATKAAAIEIESAGSEAVTDPFAESVSAEQEVAKQTKRNSKRASSPVALKKTARKPAAKEVEIAGVLIPKLEADKALTNEDVTARIAAAEPEIELSPVFKKLAEVELPKLERRNRAQLLMQSPTSLYFYWSVGNDPWQRLRSVFGNDLGSYSLVLKLIDLKRDTEEIHVAEAEGNWWFNVESNGSYQAEIGFYAPNRLYFRIIHSNSITTPRRTPSPHPASEAEWTVSANKFAEVLDVAGFARDAYDVAMAGDDRETAKDAAQSAFANLIGNDRVDLYDLADEDIRYVLLAFASGATLEDMRWRVGPALFEILQANTDKLDAENARIALGDYYDIDEAEWSEEEFGSAVYGSSLVNFPRTLKTRRTAPRHSSQYKPVSSHSIR